MHAGNVRARSTWFGVPVGLILGLKEIGAEAVSLSAGLPSVPELLVTNVLAAMRLHRTAAPSLLERIRLSRTIAMYTGRQMATIRTRVLRGKVRRAKPLDGLVQLGTGFSTPLGIRFVTFEDMTAAQAAAFPYPEWKQLSRAEMEARLTAQRKAYEHAVACCFATSWAAASAVRDYGVEPGKARIVGMGRNHSPPSGPRNWEAPRFLFVGGDWERKNGAAVVRAFARLKREIASARLDLVGDHPRLDVEGVSGHGRLSMDVGAQRRRLEQLYASATCFVMASRHEPAGIAYLDAASAALPCIGATVGGSREIIGNGGRVVDPNDDEALVDAMRGLSDPGTAARVGRLAKQRSALYTWRAVAERILRALVLPGVSPASLSPFLPSEPSLMGRFGSRSAVLGSADGPFRPRRLVSELDDLRHLFSLVLP